MKITELRKCALRLHYCRKPLLMSTFSFLLLFILSIQVSANGFSQGAKVTVNLQQVKLKKAFSILEQKGKIRILYSEESLPRDKEVSLNVKDMPILQALQLLLKGTLLECQELKDGLVVIKPSPVKAIPFEIVRGTVTDNEGKPISGVSVSVKGSSIGTTTNEAGKFSVEVPAGGILIFSYVGFTSQEIAVNGQNDISISLTDENESLSTVVVTALGIKKDRKALTYSVTQIKGEELTKAREINLGNALAGRIAGVNASGTATGPAGSTRIVIRGNGSLNGDNQPLYVVNGIPINNANQGNPGTFGGIDRGDGLISINPDDIETISVLKGGTAAALYGSRAANGVILITTKSGRDQKGLGVEFNSTYTWETPRQLYDWQYEYGSGSRGLAPTSKADAIANGRMSWGAKLDGSSVFQPDGEQRPYIAQKDNLENFYNTGKTFSNTLAVVGGNEIANFRFSASNLDNKGIVPNNSLNRKTFSLSVNANLINKVIFETSVQYNIENTTNRTFVADFQKNPNAGAQLIGTNIDVRTLSPGYDANGFEVLWNDYIYATNPYFAVNKIQNSDQRNRFIGSFSARYNITDWLYARVRFGIDRFNNKGLNIEPTGTAFNNRGSMSTDQNLSEEYNVEGIIGANKTFNKISLNVLAGGNQMKNTYDGVTLNSGFFNVPFQYFVGNGSQQSFAQNYRRYGINSLFASADVGYNDILYLNVTARQDWFSTLDIEDNSLLYPSAGVSFLFSNAWNDRPSWLSYGKLRASWAQVGGGAPSPYALDLTYQNQAQLSGTGATLQNIVGNTIPNKLKPYTSTTAEIGIETSLFDSRLGVDVTVYDRTTTDDIVNASVPWTSGYNAVALNVGEIKNRGIEVLLYGTPIKTTSGLTWDVSYNMAYNKNEVVEIGNGITSITFGQAENTNRTRTENGWIYHFVGMPFGMIAGNKIRTDDKGNSVYNNANGIPLQSPLVPLGKGVPPLTMGLNNNFVYKNFTLGFLIDGKFGAQIYSATNAYGTQFGVHKRTAENGIRESGITVTGVDQAGAPLTKNVSAQTYYQSIWNSITEEFITDADFIKLRQLIFGYTFPKRMLGKTPIQSLSLSFIARNLALLYNAADNIDPESSYSNGNAQGLENFGLPTTRSYGLNLQVKF